MNHKRSKALKYHLMNIAKRNLHGDKDVADANIRRYIDAQTKNEQKEIKTCLQENSQENTQKESNQQYPTWRDRAIDFVLKPA